MKFVGKYFTEEPKDCTYMVGTDHGYNHVGMAIDDRTNPYICIWFTEDRVEFYRADAISYLVNAAFDSVKAQYWLESQRWGAFRELESLRRNESND